MEEDEARQKMCERDSLALQCFVYLPELHARRYAPVLIEHHDQLIPH